MNSFHLEWHDYIVGTYAVDEYIGTWSQIKNTNTQYGVNRTVKQVISKAAQCTYMNKASC